MYISMKTALAVLATVASVSGEWNWNGILIFLCLCLLCHWYYM